VVLFSFSVIVLLEIIIIPFTLKHFVPFLCVLIGKLNVASCLQEQRTC
jgi:hypothetical protein